MDRQMANSLGSMINQFRPIAKALVRLGLDGVLPPMCLGCGERVQGYTPLFLPKQPPFNQKGVGGNTKAIPYHSPPINHYGLCHQCFNNVQFCGDSVCKCCGSDMLEGGNDLTCMQCLNHQPHFDRARAVWFYECAIRDIILKFKHGDATHFAPNLAYSMIPLMNAMIDHNDGGLYDAIIPVPLHWGRLFMRQYNQAALLATVLAKAYGIPCYNNHLKRIKKTPDQGHFDRAGRYDNVKNAFAYQPDKIAQWRGRGLSLDNKTLLLIDDVMTTGATVNACAKVLKQHGAKTVDVLTLCRAKRHRVKLKGMEHTKDYK